MEPPTRECLNCGMELVDEDDFCSDDCRDAYEDEFYDDDEEDE